MVSELTASHRSCANLPGVEVVSRIQSRKSPFLRTALCFYFTRAGRGETPACRLLGDSPQDISRRVDQFGDRLRALGWERTKAIWTVSQAFGGSTYWSRIPTGKEWVIQSILAVTHGALGMFYSTHYPIPLANRTLQESFLGMIPPRATLERQQLLSVNNSSRV